MRQAEDIDKSEFYEHYSISADPGQQLIRVDKFLNDRIPGISRNRIINAIKAGTVSVNDNTVKPSYKIKPCDTVSVVLPYPRTEYEIIPENIPLDIVYEDDYLLVLNKKAGMVVHPGHGNYNGTLVHALKYHFGDAPGEAGRPGLLHRLDKDTTGLMVVAKEEVAMSQLAKQFFDHTIDRRYYALVWGDINDDSGMIQGNIVRNNRDRTIMAVSKEEGVGKSAITHFNVVERFGYVTLVECRLETGRTHQIRVHFKHIGHTVFGDIQYGGNRILKGTTYGKYNQFVNNCFKLLPRQALHAKTIAFVHPMSGRKLEFNSELPDDMNEVIKKWRNYTLKSRNF